MITNEDRLDTLTKVEIYGESRPLEWVTDVKRDSRLFGDFPASTLQLMAEEPVQLHAHDYTISTETYQENTNLNSFFKLLAVDSHEGTEFIIAEEAYKYPIAGVMHHPETQNIRVFPGGDDQALVGKVNS